MLTDEMTERLLQAATEVRKRAYAPYSEFAVGAALLGQNGEIYVGCNVENAAYGLTCCAERNAIFRAVADGVRQFAAIAVITANGVTPCGSCRQVLAEFNPHLAVIVADTAGRRQLYDLAELLPAAFLPEQLPERPTG
jgi:cytidine deaminase